MKITKITKKRIGYLIFLMLLVFLPLSIALSEQNLIYDLADNDVKITYDNLNRILHKNSSSEITNYSYDKQFQGTLTNVSFGNSTYNYVYDDKLRVIEEKRTINGIEFTKKYIYDSNDRLISIEFSSGQELDIYYNPQGKIDQIKNYINNTNYNAFGNPLNRTYFNTKITTFDYYSDNARLRQIKTDTIQQLNYSYDNVGNIISINDSINNRTYSMSYDNLDRLTNVTINNFKWIYSYDAIGRVLKIVRNHSETTHFDYFDGAVHAPDRVVIMPTGVDVYRQNIQNKTNRTQIVYFYVVNDRNVSANNSNYTIEFGDGQININKFNLSINSNLLFSVEHNYTKGGSYKVNITAQNNNSLDLETINLLFGAKAGGLSILKKNASLIITEFLAHNTIEDLSQNWGWNCSNGVQSTLDFNMSSNQSIFVIMEHNFTSGILYNLTCEVNSTDGNQSITTSFNIDGIAIEDYNSTKIDIDSLKVKFKIKNYYSTLNVNWNITADNNVYQGTQAVQQGSNASIEQNIDFAKGGLKEIKLTINSGNFTDSYTEYYNINWLKIEEFYNTIKNGTARIFDFFIKNDNLINTTVLWNLTDPALENITSLSSSNESLLVIIEEDYSQGDKQVNIKIFNKSIQEDSLIEIFKIRKILINSFQTSFENLSSSITSAIITNNIAPLNVSWKLNNTQELITSNQNIELNTSEQAFIVIESNFSNAGIYSLIFQINSSIYNDSISGVAITHGAFNSSSSS